jgi:hypothetical protein
MKRRQDTQVPSTAEGHIYAFGCTEEKLPKAPQARARPQAGRQPGRRALYNRVFRVTGARLMVAACDGQFADALKRRRRLPPGR